MSKHRGFVISLAHRPDRLATFRTAKSPLFKTIDISVFRAIDGRMLEFTPELVGRIHPWNIEHLSDAKLRGIVGCAMSHIDVWNQIAKMPDNDLVAVFEDDAFPKHASVATAIAKVLATAPDDADLIWLTAWDRSSTRATRIANRIKLAAAPVAFISFTRWAAVTEKTTEAYLIRPRFAAILSAAISTNMGAIDEHMRGFCAAHPNFTCLSVSPPLFTQRDRSDTDIQIKSPVLTS